MKTTIFTERSFGPFNTMDEVVATLRNDGWTEGHAGAWIHSGKPQVNRDIRSVGMRGFMIAERAPVTRTAKWNTKAGRPDKRTDTIEQLENRLDEIDAQTAKRKECAPTHYGDTDFNADAEREAILRVLPLDILAKRFPAFAMPEGLSAKGKKAWKIVMTFLAKHNLLEGSSGKVFRNPKTWTGEYGRNSHLVILYEGGILGVCFDYDMAAEFGYSLLEGMSDAFKGSSLYTECCTSCYSAVYDA